MKTADEKKEKVTMRAVSHDEEGKKRVDKAQLDTRDLDTIKYVEKKLMDKGVMRMERHPVDGLGGIRKPPPKSGRGGKFTWEGPVDLAENELDAVPPAIDEKDPNYVNVPEAAEEDDVGEVVVGEVEVAKEAQEGVARVSDGARNF